VLVGTNEHEMCIAETRTVVERNVNAGVMMCFIGGQELGKEYRMYYTYLPYDLSLLGVSEVD